MAAAAAVTSSAVNVRQFGAIGNGLADDTRAFELALQASPAIYVPAGTYLIDKLVLPAGSSVATDGTSTRFKQRPGIRGDVRIVTVAGSDVQLGDCTVEGNIATDTGEQRHGLLVLANARTGPISNIRIGNVIGVNLRGDAVYIGTNDGASINGVRVGDVSASNILRNVVSIVGGRKISIGNIIGNRVGYTHLDIEPDAGNGPVIGCTVESVRGGFVQIAGQTANSYVDGIRIGLLNLQQPSAGSIPPYPPGLKRANALEVRNFRSIEIGRFLASGFTGAALVQVWDPGALTDQYLHISEAEFSNCCRGPEKNAYVQGSRRATHLSIDSLTVSMPRPGIDVVRDCKSARIGSLSGRLPQGSRVIAESPDLVTPLAYVAAATGATIALFRLRKRYWA